MSEYLPDFDGMFPPSPAASSTPDWYSRVAAVALNGWFVLNPPIPAPLHRLATVLCSVFVSKRCI